MIDKKKLLNYLECRVASYECLEKSEAKLKNYSQAMHWSSRAFGDGLLIARIKEGLFDIKERDD